MDDVTADFYLGIGSQEKGCRRSIRDEVSTWTKAFLSSTSKRGFYCWWYFCVFCTFCGTISERAWEKEVERCKGAGCVQERIVDCWELRRFACWQFTVDSLQSQCSHWGLLASPRTHLTSHLFFFLVPSVTPSIEGGGSWVDLWVVGGGSANSDPLLHHYYHRCWWRG